MLARCRAVLRIRNAHPLRSQCNTGFGFRFISTTNNYQGGKSWNPRESGDGTSGMSKDAKHTAREGMDEAKGQAEGMADATRDMAGSIADMAKEGTVRAMETGLNIGDEMKQAMDDAWNATKDTGKNVKDAVAGDDDSRKGADGSRKTTSTDSSEALNTDIYPHSTENRVDDLRKRGGSYDYDMKK